MYKFICRIISLKWDCWVNGYCQILLYGNFLHASVYSHQQCMSSYFKYSIKLSDFCLLVRCKKKKKKKSCNNFIVNVSIILHWKPFMFFPTKIVYWCYLLIFLLYWFFFLVIRSNWLVTLSETPFLLQDYLKKEIQKFCLFLNFEIIQSFYKFVSYI